MGAPQWGQNLLSLILPHTGQTLPSVWAAASSLSAASRRVWSSAIFSWEARTAAITSAMASGTSPVFSQAYHWPMAR